MLSERQEHILDFMRDYSLEHGYPPTIREIGSATGISSTSVVNYNLDRLEDFGYVKRDGAKSRATKLIALPDAMTYWRSRAIEAESKLKALRSLLEIHTNAS